MRGGLLLAAAVYAVVTMAFAYPALGGGFLIVSENELAGWSATVDGQPAVVGRADYTLIGVPLSAGARVVDLRYTEPMAATGLVITGVAFVVALTWLGTGVRRRQVENS